MIHENVFSRINCLHGRGMSTTWRSVRQDIVNQTRQTFELPQSLHKSLQGRHQTPKNHGKRRTYILPLFRQIFNFIKLPLWLGISSDSLRRRSDLQHQNIHREKQRFALQRLERSDDHFFEQHYKIGVLGVGAEKQKATGDCGNAVQNFGQQSNEYPQR